MNTAKTHVKFSPIENAAPGLRIEYHLNHGSITQRISPTFIEVSTQYLVS